MSIIKVMQQLVSQTGAWTLPKGKSSTILLDRVGMQFSQQAALLKMDVTHARRQIRLTNRGGQSAVSFVAWIVATVAQTLHVGNDSSSPDPQVSDRKPLTAESVAVSLIMDRVVGEHRVAVPLTIHGAECRTISDIESVIHRARALPLDPVAFVVGKSTGVRAALHRALPAFVRRRMLRRAANDRRRLDKVESNVIISTSGMGGRVKGWFIPTSRHPMCIGVGAVTPEAVVMNGSIEKREIFHMTLLLDNSVISGPSVSRWVSDLVRAVESAREFVPR